MVFMLRWWILLCLLSGHFAEVMKSNIFFLSGQTERVNLSVSHLTQQPESDLAQSELEFVWMWTSHDGRYSDVLLAKASSSRQEASTHFMDYFSLSKDHDITVKPKFECAGVFLFARTKPEYVPLAEIEVFATKFTPSLWPTFRLASDVSVSCELSRLPKGATLQWEIEGEPTSNTTVFFNNTVHMVIKGLQRRSRSYCCKIILNSRPLHSVCNAIRAEEVSSDATLTLYRESSNSSVMALLCVASRGYTHASWSWTPALTAKEVTVVTSAKYTSNVTFNIRFSSRDINSYSLPLYILPVEFEDGGTYKCYFDEVLIASMYVFTIKVSTQPANGFLRNFPVVLRCELSEVSGESVTLTWLRMNGSRGLLVKQEVLTENHPNRTLSLTLPSLRSDQLHWQCVVFTEGMLRATASLTLTMPTQTEMSSVTGMGTETMIRGGILIVATVGMLGLLRFFYCQRPKETQRHDKEPAIPLDTSV
ncbi:uncharacterized protein LOC105026256 isoform X2 [Esox lucius]|uniref:Ig-like domain-containing protein n=1 Tax=Esox lucius TaxID=8010 RepID=A0AAY5KGQ0_ESOLU|nr:uncharacterized protein LOC105026256 isoform X2 [Esox lucius]